MARLDYVIIWVRDRDRVRKVQGLVVGVRLGVKVKGQCLGLGLG